MSKYLRPDFFRLNPWVQEWRQEIGANTFDGMYRSIYNYLSKCQVGQYFYVRDLCKNPDNHNLVLGLIEIYYQMDLFVNLTYDEDEDKITILEPTGGLKSPYHPPDVYSKIVKNPEAWGVDPAHL